MTEDLGEEEWAWPSKVIPRLGLKSEDGVEGKNDETGDPWLLGCSRACDVQDINCVLRQPIFEPLSDVLIGMFDLSQFEWDNSCKQCSIVEPSYLPPFQLNGWRF